MKILDIQQGTQEWSAQRRGRITGTKLKRVMGTPFGQAELIAELIAETGTEQSKEIKPTLEMERGTAEESFALQSFQAKTGKKVEHVGMLISSTHDWLGVSPDGVIKDGNGKITEVVEVKSPDSKKLILYKMMNMIPEMVIPSAKRNIRGVPSDYIWQVVHNFIVNEDLERLHFVVYDERFIQSDTKLYTVIVERGMITDLIEKAEEELKAFRKLWLKYRDVIMPSNF